MCELAHLAPAVDSSGHFPTTPDAIGHHEVVGRCPPPRRWIGFLRGRRDGFRGRALGERFEQSLALKLSGGRADVLPAFGEKAVHQRVERRASVHGFSVGRGVREQKPFGSPQDAVGFGVEQLYFAEFLNETANCFVSVVAGCTGVVHEMLASVGKIRPLFPLFIDSLSRIGALTRTLDRNGAITPGEVAPRPAVKSSNPPLARWAQI